MGKMERIKWYEIAGGQTSGMRVIVMMVSITGCAIAAAGTVALFLGISGAESVVVTGAGMAGISNLAKAWQAQAEGK